MKKNNRFMSIVLKVVFLLFRESIHDDCEENHEALDDLLPEGRHVEQYESAIQHTDNQRNTTNPGLFSVDMTTAMRSFFSRLVVLYYPLVVRCR